MKKLYKTDSVFFLLLVAVFFYHLINIYVYLPRAPYDEVFYATVPLRLLNGDSLIKDEWHLSQFSSLFSFFSVYLWSLIKPSLEGLILFLRCFYLFIHTIIAIVVYKFFYKYNYWAICISLVFYIQVSYGIYAISYNSMFSNFLLLLTLVLLCMYRSKNKEIYLYVLSGFFYGACCVNNPVFIFAFVFYIIMCVLWRKRKDIIDYIYKRKKYSSRKINNKKHKNKTNNNFEIDLFNETEKYTCFFCAKAILWFCVGIVIIAIISIAFYLYTGGNFDSIFKNTFNMLNSSEYSFASLSFGHKLRYGIELFSVISFNKFYILPLFCLILCLDKSKTKGKNRLIYLVVAVLISLFYMFGISCAKHPDGCIFSLPFFIFSNVCYVLTEKKNKVVFYCAWFPIIIGAIANYLASNTYLSSVGVILSVSNVLGVIFVHDLFKELKPSLKSKQKYKNFQTVSRMIICIGVALHFAYSFTVLPLLQDAEKNTVKVINGPYEGLLMNESKYNEYQNLINDMDYIKSISNNDDSVLIISEEIWLYLYIDRHFATYTTWDVENINRYSLIDYYKQNKNRCPKYIYCNLKNNEMFNSEQTSYYDFLCENFIFTEENLSEGVLLKIESNKFDL